MSSHNLDLNIEYKRQRDAAAREVERWLHSDHRFLSVFRERICFAAKLFEANEKKLDTARKREEIEWNPTPWLPWKQVGNELHFILPADPTERISVYYCLLSAIRDVDLKIGEAITAGVWPPELLRTVHQRLWGFWCDNTELVKTALECVKVDLQATFKKSNERVQPSGTSDANRGRKPIVGSRLNLGIFTIDWRRLIQWIRGLRGWREAIAILALSIAIILVAAFTAWQLILSHL